MQVLGLYFLYVLVNYLAVTGIFHLVEIPVAAISLLVLLGAANLIVIRLEIRRLVYEYYR